LREPRLSSSSSSSSSWAHVQARTSWAELRLTACHRQHAIAAAESESEFQAAPRSLRNARSARVKWLRAATRGR
jgi:hypothetical protein